MIETRDLAKRFGEVEAVRQVSFTAPDGSITGLLGPNGAGKTTTLRMIATLVVPSRGSALVDGIDCVAEPLAVRARLGVLSDARGIYTRLTARENIAYYGALRGMAPAAVDAAIERLAELLDLKAVLDRRADGFSQGERMKVAIARTLVHDPPNVMLDEPTNGLDVMTTRKLREVVKRLREAGKCVLFSSHVMQEVSALCDEIVIVARGAVVAHGTAESLLAASGCTNLEDAFVHHMALDDLQFARQTRAGDRRLGTGQRLVGTGGRGRHVFGLAKGVAGADTDKRIAIDHVDQGDCAVEGARQGDGLVHRQQRGAGAVNGNKNLLEHGAPRNPARDAGKFNVLPGPAGVCRTLPTRVSRPGIPRTLQGRFVRPRSSPDRGAISATPRPRTGRASRFLSIAANRYSLRP